MLQRKVCSYPTSLGSKGVRATGPTSTNTALDAKRWLRMATPPPTAAEHVITRVGNDTVCSCTAVLRRQQHG